MAFFRSGSLLYCFFDPNVSAVSHKKGVWLKYDKFKDYFEYRNIPLSMLLELDVNLQMPEMTISISFFKITQLLCFISFPVLELLICNVVDKCGLKLLHSHAYCTAEIKDEIKSY
ncbi:hypothetical protein T07_918 [Trichinella nelsoni]|uniref:Uncharacterized protein n=1 Tax=Trichinella nelsoni TaxID=6336 RepID=A0A0V0SL23_9BILA|nr:hypothetical protein T07_918 [Trichinella nelsoni]